MRWFRAAGALIVLGGVLVVPPWLLVRFIGNPWPAEGVSWSAPLTDGAIIGLLAMGVWVLWVQLGVCVAVETISAVTDDRVQLRAPLTLGVQQQLARRLITAIVVATVSTPVAVTAAAAAAPPPAAAMGGQQHLDTQATQSDVVRHQAAQPAADQDQAIIAVTVMRLDSLWSIAERVLDDGDRWPEIAALNEGRTMSDGTTFTSADHIRPGWDLRVPTSGPVLAQSGARHVVEPGDTLSQIALEELGKADRWQGLFQRNRAVIGSDPNLIVPGQVIRLPGTGRHPHPPTIDRSPAAETPTDAETPTNDLPAAPPGEAEPETDAATRPEGTLSETAAADTAPADADEDQGGIIALRVLLASAVCLSGGALAMLLAGRRRQYRERRSGRSIAATPAGLVDVERAILEAGADSMETTEFIDLALRHLAASQRVSGDELPNVGAAVIGEEEFAVLFTEPVTEDAPHGWSTTSDRRAWTLSRDTILEDELREQPAPYPALVSVGVDPSGRTWMLDLEASGVFGVAGPGAQVEDLVRFLIAELALNSWSEGTEVMLTTGFAAETIKLNPNRVRLVDPDTATRRGARMVRDTVDSAENLGMDLLNLRRDAIAIDSTGPVVIVVSGPADDDLVDAVCGRDRSRVVVVHHDQMPAIELTGDAMAYLPAWDVTLEPHTMPAQQAAAMADLMGAVRQVQDQPMPAADEATAVGRLTTADGALRTEFTTPRAADGNDPSSLLPDADEVYVATAATTAEDLAALAPSVPAEIRAQIEALDPGLDDDLAAWRDPESRRPRVRMLGALDVDAWGERRDEVANAGGTVEFIVYVACQERGVSPDRAAVGLGWTSGTLYNRGTDARKLLGDRTDGDPWFWDAPVSPTARRTGVAAYELHPEVLVDADLFRRLCVRGQGHGAHGQEDRVAALSLVTGRPFDRLRKKGYGWLAGNPVDHHLCHAIVDVAHVIVNRALSTGDITTARWACEIAIKAAPDEEKPRTDLAAVTAAEGSGSVDDVIVEQVIDRVDADLTARTEKVIDQRGWLAG